VVVTAESNYKYYILFSISHNVLCPLAALKHPIELLNDSSLEQNFVPVLKQIQLSSKLPFIP